jgi:hypothetical protein
LHLAGRESQDGAMGEPTSNMAAASASYETPVDPPPPPAPVLWPPQPARITRIVNRPARAAEGRALAVALVLAVLFALPVTWSLQQPPSSRITRELAFAPVDAAPLLAIVTAASLLSVVIAGGLATVVARRRVVVSALIALVGGWLIAASVVPALASWLGLPLMAGSYCIDGCLWAIQPGHPADGLVSALVALAFAVITVLPASAAAVLLLGGLLLSRSGRPVAAVVLAGLGWTAINYFGVGFSVAIPFLLQVLGVVFWAAVLWEPWRRRGSAAAPAPV